MRIPIFQLNAFAARRFQGNPAAVMPLDQFLPDALAVPPGLAHALGASPVEVVADAFNYTALLDTSHRQRVSRKTRSQAVRTAC